MTIMSAIKTYATRHPALTYYALAFALSWGGLLIVIGPTGFPGTSEEVERLMPFAILAFVIGPALAGPLLTGFVYGKAGLREFPVPVAEVAGGRLLVRGGALDRPTFDDGGTPCPVAVFP